MTTLYDDFTIEENTPWEKSNIIEKQPDATICGEDKFPKSNMVVVVSEKKADVYLDKKRYRLPLVTTFKCDEKYNSEEYNLMVKNRDEEIAILNNEKQKLVSESYLKTKKKLYKSKYEKLLQEFKTNTESSHKQEISKLKEDYDEKFNKLSELYQEKEKHQNEKIIEPFKEKYIKCCIKYCDIDSFFSRARSWNDLKILFFPQLVSVVDEEDLELVDHIMHSCPPNDSTSLYKQIILLLKFFGVPGKAVSPSYGSSGCSHLSSFQWLFDKLAELRKKDWFCGHLNEKQAVYLCENIKNSFFCFYDLCFKKFWMVKVVSYSKEINSHVFFDINFSSIITDVDNPTIEKFVFSHSKNVKPFSFSDLNIYQTLSDTFVLFGCDEKYNSEGKKIVRCGMYQETWYEKRKVWLFKISDFDKNCAIKLNNWQRISCRHPHIAPFFGVLKEEKSNHLVYSTIQSSSHEREDNLFNYSRGQRISEKKILDIMTICVNVLEYVHSFGYTVNCLSPSHMFINSNEHFEIGFDLDFIVLKHQIKLSKNISEWLAPEIEENPRYGSEKSDIYSLGKNFFYMLKKQDEVKHKNMMSLFGSEVSFVTDFDHFKGVEGSRNKLFQLIEQCSSVIPSNRPSLEDFSSVLKNLSGAFNKYQMLSEKLKKYQQKVNDLLEIISSNTDFGEN